MARSSKVNIKEGDLFINTFDRMTVIKYCFRCPATGDLMFEDISTTIVGRQYTCYYYHCYYCKHHNKCRSINNMYSFNEEAFDCFLKTGEVVKYNKLNAILYLREEYREKVEKWIKEYLK